MTQSLDSQDFTLGEILENINNKVDLDCANISDVGKKVFDGQWVTKVQALFSEFSLNNANSAEFSLSEYLPNDGYTYEVRAIGYAWTWGDHANSSTELRIIDAIGDVSFGRAWTSSADSRGSVGTNNLIIDNTRTISVKRSTSHKGTGNLALYGYRRVGTLSDTESIII